MYILSKIGIILQVTLLGDTQKNNSIGILGLLVFMVGWFGPLLIYAKKTKQNNNLSSISESEEQIKIIKNKEIIKYATYLAIVFGIIVLLVSLLKEPNKNQEVNVNNYDDCSTVYVDFKYEVEADHFIKALNKTVFDNVIISVEKVI